MFKFFLIYFIFQKVFLLKADIVIVSQSEEGDNFGDKTQSRLWTMATNCARTASFLRAI
jgi:hypothetical protein